jgi:DNA-binding MarR family transcriptional regulator
METELWSADAAIAHLRSYQQDYPDYDAEDWLMAVKGALSSQSVLSVAQSLAARADWSLRGIEASRRELASDTGYSAGTVSAAVRALEGSGFVLVARRSPRSDGTKVRQHSNSYRLSIPGGATWNMPDFTP